MKRVIFVLLLLALGSLVWGQEVLRQEHYIMSEIGNEAFSNLTNSLISSALNDYNYCYYAIYAPYNGDTNYTGWATAIYII